MPDTAMTAPAPFAASVMRIEPEWIDYNGHLNMAYYNVLFDRSIDQLFAELGVGPNYLATRNHSTMTAECHVRYLREIGESDPVQVHTWLLDADQKRLHTFQELRHATENWISATSENMTLHIDMAMRRVAPFPPDIMAKVLSTVEAHRRIPRPEGIGRQIAMPRR